MSKVQQNNHIFHYPHGLRILTNSSVIVVLIVILAIAIIPISIMFELSRYALIFILFMIAASFLCVIALLQPRIYMKVTGTLVSVNTNRFWGEDYYSFSLIDIERIRIETDSIMILHVIPVATEETGIILVNKLGDDIFIARSNFNTGADYQNFKTLIIKNAPDVIKER